MSASEDWPVNSPSDEIDSEEGKEDPDSPVLQSEEEYSVEEEIEIEFESEQEDSDEESESTMSTTGAGTQTAATSTQTVGGVVIELSDVANTTSVASKPLYKKDERYKLSEDKLIDLFDKATRTKITKFDLLSLTLSSEDKLDDTYNLGIQIGKLRAHFIKYDMHDVFTVVKVDESDGKTVQGTSDLFADFSKLTESEVAKSNAWYNRWPKEDYFRQNLQLTFDFLENNSTEALWEKSFEEYEEYDLEQRGGPLIFIIMMKKLQSDTDNAVQYLISSVKNMKISSIEGENVSRAVSLVRGAYKRLKSVGTNKVPEEFPNGY